MGAVLRSLLACSFCVLLRGEARPGCGESCRGSATGRGGGEAAGTAAGRRGLVPGSRATKGPAIGGPRPATVHTPARPRGAAGQSCGPWGSPWPPALRRNDRLCLALCLHSRAERVFCSSAFSSVGVDLLLPPFPPPFPCLLGELFSSSSSSSNLSIFPLPSRPCYN